MDILFLITTLGGGGAEKVLTDIVNNLDDSKYNITVMTVYDEGVYRDQLNNNIQYKAIVKNPSRIKKAIFWRLIKLLPKKLMYKMLIHDKYDAEVAFLEGLSTHILSGSSCDNTIAWIHTDLKDNNYVSDYFSSDNDHARCYACFDKIVSVSTKVQAAFMNSIYTPDIDKNKLQVITNYIPGDMILKKALDVPKTLTDLDDDTSPILCNVGSFKPIKAHIRLLSIHKKLLDNGIKNRLWLVGEGAERGNIEQYIAENHLENTVTLWGFNTNPYPFVDKSDIFVLSSYAEGYPLCLSEALVLKKPIITTKCAGTDEILADGKYGIITENTDDALYESLYAVLSNPQNFDKLRQMAVDGAECFDNHKILNQIEDLFDK